MKFDDFFKVRKNVIYERARFNQRCQRDDENMEQFIASLYSLADRCEFEDLRDSMIRDRIVVGIRDKTLSESLQMDSKLTLEDAKRKARQREAVSRQQEVVQDGAIKRLEPVTVKQRNSYYTNPSRHYDRKPSKPMNQSPAGGDKCTRCGRRKHSRQDCPAREAVCHACKKRGHFSSQCFSRKTQSSTCVNAIVEEDNTYLNAVTIVGTRDQDSNWLSCTVSVNNQDIKFKVDTGAEVTVITEDVVTQLGIHKTLRPTKRLLCGPDGNKLPVAGEVSVRMKHGEHSITQTVYVLRRLQQSLLGLPAIRALRLLTQVDQIKSSVPERYPSLFKGLGTFNREYEIKIKQNAQPHALYTARTVSLPLRQKVKDELDRMVELGVISQVHEPTEWCAGMVVVPKKSGSVRICVDFRVLNESVLREVHPLPTVDETLAHLKGATVFSKLDANSGFWQIPLSKNSQHLTTFISPYGRYCFHKLPFGISSAPEYFQRCMSEILAGCEGVLCHIDDIIIFGKDEQEHDQRLDVALRRIQGAGVTLNIEKCEFQKTRLLFLGHIIDRNGISADPSKTSAIVRMESPKSITELRRFMGMVNQLGKFSSHIAELAQPLRELLSTKNAWIWEPPQEEAFIAIKKELSQPTTLAIYDPDLPTKISSDASAYGLGAVLMQRRNSEQEWKPVAYASRFMSETEQRYSQIEKEALGIVWACEKFKEYVLGKHIGIETDHKPLVPLLSTANLTNLPPRVLRFRLRLSRFSYGITHVPGKLLYTADTLSRAPTTQVTAEGEEVAMESFVQAILSSLPASEARLKEYSKGQEEDGVCSKLIRFCQSEWPNRSEISQELLPYWTVRTELSYVNKVLLYRNRIVVPKSLQRTTLQKIHCGHQGIRKCYERVVTAVWWPCVISHLEEFIKACPECNRTTPLTTEPLLVTSLPNHPWEKVAADLFQLKGSVYLVVVDYFSRFIEVQQMTSTTAAKVISVLKSIFARYGIPAELVTDNGPQFACKEMEDFATEYNFSHITSSPYYPQANGLAERSVKTIKELLRNAEDPYMALLTYRATPLPWCHLSPSELLMGRRVRTDVPQVTSQFVPDWPYLQKFKAAEMEYKRKQKEQYDRRKRVRTLPLLESGTSVWVNTQDRQVQGTVTHTANTPRSYYVDTPTGQVRRNRRDLRPRPAEQSITQEEPDPTNIVMTRSRTGVGIRPPDRLTYNQ